MTLKTFIRNLGKYDWVNFATSSKYFIFYLKNNKFKKTLNCKNNFTEDYFIYLFTSGLFYFLIV